jgi:gamma-glutamyltranspeptidase/glutathione hydrolase
MSWTLDRRTFVAQVANGVAATCCGMTVGRAAEAGRIPERSGHAAQGRRVAVTSTSKESTGAALWILDQGGNAADAYLAAALTQTVVEPGLTSLGGGLAITYFDAATKKTSGVVGRLGPAAAESYDYGRNDAVTQSGRAMPVPGFVAGIQAAHAKFGVMPWERLFQPAIRHARDGFAVPAFLVAAAKWNGTRRPEGRSLWMKDGRLLNGGETLVQAELGKVLESLAEDGPAAFYEGEFAAHYVKRAQQDGGKLTLDDMSRWRERVTPFAGPLEGDYRGYQVCSPRAGLLTYALHLTEALDLKASGPAHKSPESVFRQWRIMEEVFLAAKNYTPETHAQFVARDYAKQRAGFVLNSPLREVTLDALFNTSFVVVRDAKGNCAWGTHSINTPTAFGAGIVVDGVYAAYAMHREHVHGHGASAPGITTSYALFKAGAPRIICGSPGFGFVHGPYQYGTGIVEWGLSPVEAMHRPRFGLPDRDGTAVFESHYDESVFAMLEQRGIKHRRSRVSTATGLVGALVIDDDGTLHVTQDSRRDGFAEAQ